MTLDNKLTSYISIDCENYHSACSVKTNKLCYSIDDKIILNNVSLNVKSGSIYALIGPSGCGKSTLLKCLLGQKRPKSGNVEFNFGHFQAKIPGHHVGYMPQEYALIDELTINELIRFMAQLNGVDIYSTVAGERINKILSIFQLEHMQDNFIKTLSGGEKRRVSLAAALAHSPPLLVLDEPTVGVDPLLRRTIWKYLLSLVDEFQTTIIVTTHFIEEARHSSTIALLRNGSLLAEASPEYLLAKFSTQNLEHVFIKLCVQYDFYFTETLYERNYTYMKKIATSTYSPSKLPKIAHKSQESLSDGHSNFNVIKSLIGKTVKRFRRSKSLLWIQLLLPALQILAICMCIAPQDNRKEFIAVSSDDMYFEGQTSSTNYSQRLLDLIVQQNIELTNFNTRQEAIDAVRNGEFPCALIFKKNFSQNMADRLKNPFSADRKLIDGSTAEIFIVKTRLPFTAQIKLRTRFILAQIKFITDILRGSDTIAVENFRPIFDFTTKHSLGDYLVPGLILLCPFFLAAGTSTLVYVQDIGSGAIERMTVANVRHWQIQTAFLLVQFVSIVPQAVALIVVMKHGFGYGVEGSSLLAIVFIVLQGLIGVSYGFLISAINSDIFIVCLIMTGSLLPLLILSGTLWPLEDMATGMRTVALLMPQTTSVKAIRLITSSGVGIECPIVYTGLLVAVMFFIGFFAVSLLLRNRDRR